MRIRSALVPLTALGFAVLLASARLDAQRADSVSICLAPARVETSVGNADAAVAAVRESLTAYLTGPTLGVSPLSARLESQAREEAKRAGCRFLLLTSVKHSRKSGGGLLGRAAAGAVRDGAWSAASSAGSTTGRVAAVAAAGAASEAAWGLASSIQNKDELALSYRLESGDRTKLLERSEKRKASADGEDLLTPMVERAAEAVAGAVSTAAPNGGKH